MPEQRSTPRSRAGGFAAAPPRYVPHRAKTRERCDRCVDDLIAGRRETVANRAVVVRVAGDGSRAHLCGAHEADWREIDGMPRARPRRRR